MEQIRSGLEFVADKLAEVSRYGLTKGLLGSSLISNDSYLDAF